MRILLLASLGALALAGEQASHVKAFDCGTDTSHASDDFLKTIEALHGGNPNPGSLAARAALTARVKAATGPIAMTALNTAYSPYNMQFNLINVTWTTNDAWAVGEKDDDSAMKSSLRQGTYRTLNLYFQTDLAGGVLGWCTLPSAIANDKSDPTVYSNDGCNINAHTMPSGTLQGYNSGMTAVHETGHWLGLLHTFEGYCCEGPGDYIDDRPMEATATDGCPVDPKKQTCPGNGDAGDPIHNFMDYPVDSCYEGFSRKQVERMGSMWGLYRDKN